MNKIRITIDPGHGGKSCNNVGFSKKYYEHIGMLQLSLMLREELLSTGAFEVMLTRTANVTMDLLPRAKVAANFKSDMFISEHTNAGGTMATGAEVLYSLKRPQDKAFAELMSAEISKTLGIVTRGAKVKQGSNAGVDYFGILRYGSQLGIPHSFIIESAFHSNPKEEAMLLNPVIMRKIAQAQARVICNFYKVQYPVVGQPIQPTPTTPQPQPISIRKGIVIASTLACMSIPSNKGIRNGLLRQGATVNIYKEVIAEGIKWYLVNNKTPQWCASHYIKIVQ